MVAMPKPDPEATEAEASVTMPKPDADASEAEASVTTPKPDADDDDTKIVVADEVVDLDAFNFEKLSKKKYNKNYGKIYFCPFGRPDCVITQSRISQHIRRKHSALLHQSSLLGGNSVEGLVQQIKTHTLQKIEGRSALEKTEE